ncbi:protein kinase domain-containing protein [Myxococcus guangdongensis]|uniref:protein kinase domain-containing protein n=1 Tax=Myxococcus guangdongensis TaxID=2906760 RepID=UPI00225E6CC7|nr:protein kinase [Myxococcus guangdongensis]
MDDDRDDVPEAARSTVELSLAPGAGETGLHGDSSVGHYTLLALLGRGGMGEVHKAWDRRLSRTVALKFVRGGDPDRVMRFLQEAQTQARIEHPNVCAVYEVGHAEGRHYIAMQLIEGQRLDQVAGGLSLPEKVQVMREVASAMYEAHNLGVIHRDLKPGNIMVRRLENGRCFPVVMDFGLAHEVGLAQGLTRSGAVMGTPAYMSPEQARGDTRAIDRRSDVYGLGATLHELLAGVPPFSDKTLLGTLNKVLHEDAPSLRSLVPHLPGDLEVIVLKCLSKDPEQRYASARALAEDLGRYLDGEPILGQRPALLSRLWRRARKHRTLVAVSVMSLASILVLSVLGVTSRLDARHARLQSEVRARMAEQLGQQVKDIEWFLRLAYTTPLHDTGREQQLVRERMARIAAWRHTLGEPGDALVQYALGRGHLAMHELEQAHEALTRARRLGLDSPELHHALGRVLGERYHQAMEEARRGGDATWVAERQRIIEAQYLQPALQSLERSRVLELESPRYLEGLIAFYRRDYDAAARAATLAEAQAPWSYEARKLAGDVAHARAMEQLERGEYDAARSGLREARRLHERAVELGRSDARSYEALAEVGLQEAELDRRQGQLPHASLEKALAAAEQGLQAAPSRGAGYTRKAFILINRYRAANAAGQGLDPKPILADCLATASRAVELSPQDVQAHDILGVGHFFQGLRAAWEEKDPEPAWGEAISRLERALELQPQYPWGLNDLALVHHSRGTHQRERGEDPSASYAEAERLLRLAVRHDPKYVFGFSNLAELYNAMAAHGLARGLDPEPEVQKAIAAGEAALAINGNFHSALNKLGLSELLRAEHLVVSGADARAPLERASHWFERSLGINPTFGRSHFFLAMGHWLSATHAVREDRDPGASLQAGQRALAAALRGDKSCADCQVLSARLALVEAAWARRSGLSGLRHLQHAHAEARRAVEIHPYNESHEVLARACWRLAQVVSPSEAPGFISEGLAQVDLALGLDSKLASAHAVRGGLRLLQSRLARGDEERAAHLSQARESLSRAMELRPLLRREDADALREAGFSASRD